MQYLFLLISWCTFVVDSANILGIFPSPGRSQFILGEKLMGELAKRGHNVTVISAYLPTENIKNYQTILVDKVDVSDVDLLAWKNMNEFENVHGLVDTWMMLSEGLVAQQPIHDLINSNSTFDLVIFENFGNEAQMGFAKHFDAPLVVFSSLGMTDWCSNFVGNIRLPSITSQSVAPRTNKMTFYQRCINTAVSLYDYVYKEFIYFPKQQKIMHKYFGEEMNLQDVMRNVTFLLLNSHPLTAEPSLLTSAAIEIGGFHVTANKLPNDIEKFLDDAKNGAIMFSLGSNIDTTLLSNETVEGLFRAISKLPQRVVWKFDNKDIPNKPNNLLISPWLPQSDILAHPNIVAFVTHSGFLSVTEATYHGVPMVVVPIFGDQYINALRAVDKGVAIELDLSNLNEDTFYTAVNQIVTNKQYKEKMTKLSQMFRDRPVHPLDLAVHTIEYVLKYKPAEYFRSPALDLYWFQLYLLDILVVGIVIWKILKKTAIRDRRNKKVKTS